MPNYASTEDVGGLLRLRNSFSEINRIWPRLWRSSNLLTMAGLAILLLGSIPALADDFDTSRWPYRLPEWIWDDPSYAYLDAMTPKDVVQLRDDIAKYKVLRGKGATFDTDASALNDQIARKLASAFSVRDLLRRARIVVEPHSGASVALIFDPKLSQESQLMLETAAAQYLRVALDPQIIGVAWNRSTDAPPPMPAMYIEKNGKAMSDDIGRPAYTADYKNFLKYRVKPRNPEQFLSQLRTALIPADGDPVLILLSTTSNGVWWGYSYYDFFFAPQQQLARENPPRGYISIAINTDRLNEGVSNRDDPNFWASKFGHEIAHNLGYWHPVYKDPGERDRNNVGTTWDFIVSYEKAILEKLGAP
jgi:hypothetical protein